MTAITSAGAGSGIDLESVISASVAAKKTQLQQPITTQQSNTQITLSGVGQLKSAISSFTSVLDTLSATGAFNKRAVNITQSTDTPVLKVEAKTDAANGQYNITVNKLATTSRLESSFASSTTSLATADGTLTFKAGTKSFTVAVAKGDNLQNIRSKINSSGDNFGLSANIVNASDGTAKLVIDSGISGDGNNLSISASTTELGSSFATKQMAQTQMASSTTHNVFAGSFAANSPAITTAGNLTIKSGSATFNVPVSANTTLQQISDNINSAAAAASSKFTSKVVTNTDGTSTLTFDSGTNGDSLNVSGSTTELGVFNTAGPMMQTQAASSASINVDGNTVTSDTNVFDDKIQGLKLTVLRTSDKDSSGNLTSNKVAITTDTSSIQSMVQKFIDGYNTLVSGTTAIGKRSTIVSGVSQNDGGALAGDSTPRAVRSMVTNTLLTASTQSTVFSTIFELGVSMDNDGKLSLDSNKFSTALDKNYDQVVALFGGAKGVAGIISTGLKEYTKTGGLLSIREDSLNTTLRSLSQKQNTVTEQLAKYETTLRQQYGNLDTLLANMKKSASYLTSLTTTSTTSSA